MSSSLLMRTQFVDEVPVSLEPGVLYVSTRYRTAAHLCPCSCGLKVVTPIRPTRWSLTWDGDSTTLAPSIGLARMPCGSHYFIRNGHVVRLPPEGQAATEPLAGVRGSWIHRLFTRARRRAGRRPPSGRGVRQRCGR